MALEEALEDKSNNEKEIITNALLEASKNLMDKIENNIEKISQLNQKLKNRGINQKEKKERKFGDAFSNFKSYEM